MVPDPAQLDTKLDGTSLAERYKNLNKLIKDATPEELDPERLKDFPTKSQIEQIYITKLADRFRDGKLICELLQSQNEIVVSFALHADWFFRGDSHLELVNPNHMVEKVFPNATYHAVCRIINALSVNLKNEKLAEEYYGNILLLFGKDMAVRFLPVCSVDFIKSIMKPDVEFSNTTLHYIYKKDPQIIQDYLEGSLQKLKEEKKYYKLNFRFNFLWVLIAENYPEWFVTIFEKYREQIHFKLGKKTTFSIVTLMKDTIIKEPIKYIEFFHMKTVFVTLKTEDLETCTLNLMDENERSYNFFYNILSHLHPKSRTRLMLKLYPLKYEGKSILERDDVEKLIAIEHLPEEVRIKYVNEKIKKLKPSDIKEDETNIMSSDCVAPCGAMLMIQSMRCSMPLKRKRIVKPKKPSGYIDAAKRLKWIKRLLDGCKINKDNENLLEVLELIAKRYRNDRPHVRLEILNHLFNNFKLHELSLQHWTHINEIVDFLWSKESLQWSDRLKTYLIEYIHFCMKNGKEYESTVDKFIKYNFRDINLLKGVKEYEFILHDLFLRKYKDLIDADPESDKSYDYIAMIVQSFGERSDGKKISVADCDWLIELLKNKFSQGTDAKILSQYQLMSILKSDVKTRQIFGDVLIKKMLDLKLIDNFLKHDSQLLFNDISRIIDNVSLRGNFKDYLPIFRKIRAYYMKPLGDKIVNELKNKISNGENKECDKTVLFTLLLCLLLDSEDTENLIKPLLPVETKITDNMDKKAYELGELLGNKLKYINPSLKFDIILNFARDDYLKFALPSLLSVVFKKPLKESQDLVVELTRRPVSIKKHGIRLAYVLYPSTNLLELYRNLWDQEKNRNIREVIFQRTFKLMETVTTLEEKREIWSSIKHFFSSFSKKDLNLYPYLIKSQSLPSDLLNDYFDTCWKTTLMLKIQKMDMSSTLLTMSQTMREHVDKIDFELAQSVIVQFLDSLESKSDKLPLLYFLVDYLIKVKDADSREKILQLTCEAYKKIITEKWEFKDKNGEYQYRHLVFEFVTKICEHSSTAKSTADLINLLKQIEKMISDSLPFHVVFNLHVKLNIVMRFLKLFQTPPFTNLQMDSMSDNTDVCTFYEQFGESIADYLDSMCNEYSPEIGNAFCKIYNRFQSHLYSHELAPKMKLQCLNGLIKGKPSRARLLMAVHELNYLCAFRDKQHDEYVKLLDKIKSMDDATVNIILSNKLTLYW